MSRRREAPARVLDAGERAHADLVRVIGDAPEAAALLLGAAVARLDRLATPAGSSAMLDRALADFRRGASCAAGALEDAARAAGVELIAPPRPVSTVPEVPDVEMYDRKRIDPAQSAARRAARQATRTLRDNVRSAGNGR